MSVNINLIPQQIVPKSFQLKIYKSIKILNITIILAFILVTIVLVMIISANKLRISSEQKKYNDTVAEFNKLKDIEQKYVLLKNRIDGIRDSVIGNSILDDVIIFYETIDNFPEGTTFSGIKMQKGSAEFSMNVDSTNKLSQALVTAMSIGKYSGVYLNSFSFSPSSGYGMKITLTVSQIK